MINQLKGEITHKEIGYLILDVSGVGYKVHTGISDVGDVGEEILLWTHLSVREDALDLYGFTDRENLSFFEQLIKVSGIGPKSAMNILAIASLDTLTQAIIEGDASYLTKVSGIGRKTAEKIILELRDKIGPSESSGTLSQESDVIEALVSLGYQRREAQEVLRKLPKESGSAKETSEKIREALKLLGRNG